MRRVPVVFTFISESSTYVVPWGQIFDDWVPYNVFPKSSDEMWEPRFFTCSTRKLLSGKSGLRYDVRFSIAYVVCYLLTNNNLLVELPNFLPTITGFPYFSLTLGGAKAIIVSSIASFTCCILTVLFDFSSLSDSRSTRECLLIMVELLFFYSSNRVDLNSFFYF